MISKGTTDVLPTNPSTISIHREIRRSDASSIFEIELNGKCYAMKVVSVPKVSSRTRYSQLDATNFLEKPRRSRSVSLLRAHRIQDLAISWTSLQGFSQSRNVVWDLSHDLFH
jgi:hypothetical protein